MLFHVVGVAEIVERQRKQMRQFSTNSVNRSDKFRPVHIHLQFGDAAELVIKRNDVFRGHAQVQSRKGNELASQLFSTLVHELFPFKRWAPASNANSL